MWGERKGAYRVLVRKLEGKRQIGRQHRWADNITMILKETGQDGMH
jgi:hypothetical protein